MSRHPVLATQKEMNIAEIAQAAGASIALMTLIVGVFTATKGFFEFRRDNSLKRIEKFQQMRNKYGEDEQIQRVDLALNFKQDQPDKFRDAVIGLDFNDKMAFLMFFEEVALLHNSGILNVDVVFYSFSWDALLAYESDEFWDSVLKRDDPYLALFK